MNGSAEFFAPVPEVNTAILYWLSDDFDMVVMLEENSGHHQHKGSSSSRERR